jgi:hypothetical protein
VHSYTTALPATAQGIRRYLGSGMIKGVGPVIAERMVAHFGVHITHIIESGPARLIDVDGLGSKRTAMITAAWAEQKAIKEVMVSLQGVGVSTSLAVRIYNADVWASVSRPPTPSPPRPPGADKGGAGVHPVRGGRRWPLLPARAQPDRRRGQDPRGAGRADRPVPGRAGRGRGRDQRECRHGLVR